MDNPDGNDVTTQPDTTVQTDPTNPTNPDPTTPADGGDGGNGGDGGDPTPTWYDDLGLEEEYVTENKGSLDKFKDIKGVVKSSIEAQKKISELSQAQKAPENYSLDMIPEEHREQWSGAFKELGLSQEKAEMAYNMMKADADRVKAENFDAEKLNELVPEDTRKELSPMIRKYQPEGKEAVFKDGMTNEQVAWVYGLLANVKKAHGISEGDLHNAPNNDGSGMTQEQIETKLTEIDKQIIDLSKRPHSQADKDKLMNEKNVYLKKLFGGKK